MYIEVFFLYIYIYLLRFQFKYWMKNPVRTRINTTKTTKNNNLVYFLNFILKNIFKIWIFLRKMSTERISVFEKIY